jgi:hypothetical protein
MQREPLCSQSLPPRAFGTAKRALTWLGTLQALPAHTLWVLRKHLGEHERITTAIGEAETRLAAALLRETAQVESGKQMPG